jgi:thiopeptide-type bacteriocin biosynthesis protein
MQPQNSTQPQVRRTFIPGDEWLYYKFYTGPKTADIILTDVVKPMTEQLLSQGVIDHWFFIRYGDPRLHLRVRFHFRTPGSIGTIVQAVQEQAAPYVAEDLIWRVQTDTYQREVERYTPTAMEAAEILFFHDSRMIVDMLTMIEGDEGEVVRWLFGVRCIDALLDDFKYDLPRKLELFEILKGSFAREFRVDKGVKNQLKNKYRNERPHIEEILDRGKDQESEMRPLFELLDRKSAAIRPVAEQILDLDRQQKLGRPLNDLMGSYIHMLNNRLFKSKQRVHEMVIYDFLYNHYRSTLARQKYNK